MGFAYLFYQTHKFTEVRKLLELSLREELQKNPDPNKLSAKVKEYTFAIKFPTAI